MSRIFFALGLPPAIKDALFCLGKAFSVDKGTVKWVAKENIHLTLQFIGDVDQDRLAALLAAAQKTAQECSPFSLKIAGTGVFPNPARPRVLWAGITNGKEELRHLAQHLSASIDIRPDKPFSPHLTLGRVREGRQVDVGPFLHSGANFDAGTIQVVSFSCLESTLTPQGPIYKTVAEFFL